MRGPALATPGWACRLSEGNGQGGLCPTTPGGLRVGGTEGKGPSEDDFFIFRIAFVQQ